MVGRFDLVYSSFDFPIFPQKKISVTQVKATNIIIILPPGFFKTFFSVTIKCDECLVFFNSQR